MPSSLRVPHRLLVGFASLLLLSLILGAVLLGASWWQGNILGQMDTAAVEAADGMAEAARQAYDTAVQVTVNEGSQAALEEFERIDQAISVFAQQLTSSRATATAPAARNRLENVASAFATFEGLLLAHAAQAQAGAPADERQASFALVREAYVEDVEPLLSAHALAASAALRHQIGAAKAAMAWTRRFAVGGILLLMATIGGIALLATRHVSSGLDRCISAARSIASGELSTPVRVTSADEFGEITEALNEIVVQLASTNVSKTYVENIVHNMADPLVVVDSDVCISMVNPALLELLGYGQRDLLSTSVTKIFAHAGRGRGAAIKRDIEHGLSGNVETRFRRRDGSEVPVSLSSAVVRANGQIQGLVLVAKDITALKEREQDLIRARDEAERMVQLRDAFLANMSHEIRTPLTGILGSAQILAGVVEGEHRKLASIIEDAGNRLLDTINSVLEMARIEAGEVQPEIEILDLTAEAEAVAAVLRPVAEKKGLRLEVMPPPRGHVAAQLDRSCLNRILNNLIGNAIKFTTSGSVSIEITSDGEDAVVSVRDTGIGISKEFLPHLFDDFKQESTGLKRSHEGTGLGLAITRKLVDMMGGNIQVDSVKGMGSTFSIRFEMAPYDAVVAAMVTAPAAHEPVRTKAPAAPPERAEAPLPLSPWTEKQEVRDILLVEDNQQNAYMARFMLEGYNADIATTPEEALQFASQFAYRVLLVDINLGGDISGIDLLHTLRQDPNYASAPAVAVTAYALPGDRERFLNDGFDDYLSKPYRRELLHEAVERALESSRAEESAVALEEVLQPAINDGSEPSPGAGVEAHSEGDGEADVDYPVASPEDFLPTTFQPDFGAFTDEAADVVLAAERAQTPSHAKLPPLHDDLSGPVYFDVGETLPGDPARPPGAGPGRAPGDPG